MGKKDRTPPALWRASAERRTDSMNGNSGTLERFADSLSRLIRQEYDISEEYYRGDVKRDPLEIFRIHGTLLSGGCAV